MDKIKFIYDFCISDSIKMSISYPNWDAAMFAYTISAHILLVTLSMGLAITITIAEFLALKKKDKYCDALVYKLSRGYRAVEP